MKLSLLVVLIFASVAYSADNVFEQRASALQQLLQEKWQEAQANAQHQAKALIAQAMKLTNLASKSENSDLANNALESAEKVVPTINAMVAGAPATRSGVVNAVASLVSVRKELLGADLGDVISKFQKQGMGALAEVLKPALAGIRNEILKNEDIKKMVNGAADALDIVEDAVTLLNNLSGGTISQLNIAAQAISNFDKMTDTLLDRQDNQSKNLVISKILSALLKAKNSGSEFAVSALTKLCSSMDKAKAA